jgi:ABC-type uncharacterized transport system permease subunit
MGRLHPLGVVLSAMLMSLLYIGGETAQIELQAPSAITGIFQGLLLFYLLAADLFIHYRIKPRKRGCYPESKPDDYRIVDRFPRQHRRCGHAAGGGVDGRTGDRALRRAQSGLEGMMLVGAVVGFGVTLSTGSMSLGLLAAMAAGMLMALVFGFLVLTLQTNQVATGLH